MHVQQRVVLGLDYRISPFTSYSIGTLKLRPHLYSTWQEKTCKCRDRYPLQHQGF